MGKGSQSLLCNHLTLSGMSPSRGDRGTRDLRERLGLWKNVAKCVAKHGESAGQALISIQSLGRELPVIFLTLSLVY